MDKIVSLALAALLLIACGQSGKNDGKHASSPAPSTVSSAPSGKSVDPPKRSYITPKFFSGSKPSLKDYLSEPMVLEEVYNLGKIGFDNYDPKKTLGQARSKNYGKTGGGRSGDWIKDTLGQSESAIRASLENLSLPPTWSIKEINEVYKTAKIDNDRSPMPTFFLVQGVGINYLQDVPLGNNAIVQLASQFNYLESKNDSIADVSGYLGDRTQGPQGVIEALAATMLRDALVRNEKLAHALIDVLPAGADSYYKNGYLKLYEATTEQKAALKAKLDTEIGKVRILPQWVLCEPSGSVQLQVFSAAPSFQAASMPDIKDIDGQICSMLVSAQYEAIAKLAVIRAQVTGKPVPVHFTLVGQGAFANPPQVMAHAFKAVADVVKGHDIQVYIHAFGEDAKTKVLQAGKANKASYNLVQLAKNEFEQKTVE